MKTIGVFGSSRREEGSDLYRQAYELGGALARAGYAVLTGGYAGSMGAASRGAAEAGGRVIGVTCAIFDPTPPNPWLTEEIKAPSLLARLGIMLDRADGFVAVRGGIGTLVRSHAGLEPAANPLAERWHTAGAARRRVAGRAGLASGAHRPGPLHRVTGTRRRHAGRRSRRPDRAPNTSWPSARRMSRSWGGRAMIPHLVGNAGAIRAT